MKMKDQQNVAFLFGAGVELAFGLPSGTKFFQQCIYPEKRGQMDEIRQEFQGHCFDKEPIELTTNRIGQKTEVLRQITLSNLKSLNGNYDSFTKTELSWIRCLIENYGAIRGTKNIPGIERIQKAPKNVDEKTKAKLKTYLQEALENYGRGVENENFFGFYKKLFMDGEKQRTIEPINLTAELDSCFHSILSPNEYGEDKFTKVFLFYWNCYFAIVKGLLKKYGELSKKLGVERRKLWKWCRQSNKLFEIKPCQIIKSIHEFTRFLYGSVLPFLRKNALSAYRFIAEEFDKNKGLKPVGVLTTNYGDLSPFITSNGKRIKTAYLCGELKLFEKADTSVFDTTKENPPENEFFFPFLLGQSLIKPLINGWQIDQLDVALSIVKRADVLVVYGHSLQRDDTWIVSLLKKHVDQGGRLIVACDKETKERLEKREQFNLVREKTEFCVLEFKNGANDLEKEENDRENVKKIFEKLQSANRQHSRQ